jgi:hypothetical protein
MGLYTYDVVLDRVPRPEGQSPAAPMSPVRSKYNTYSECDVCGSSHSVRLLERIVSKTLYTMVMLLTGKHE